MGNEYFYKGYMSLIVLLCLTGMLHETSSIFIDDQSDQIDELKMILEDASRTGQKVFVEEFTGLS